MIRRKKPRYGTLAYYLLGLSADDAGKRIISSRYIRSGALYGADNGPLLGAMPQLVAALSDHLLEVRLNIAYAIGYAIAADRRGPSAFGALFVHSAERMPQHFRNTSDGVASRRDELRRAREEYLKARLPDVSALPRLLELAATGSEPVRVEAVATMGLMGREARPAVPQLRPLIQSEVPALQVAALVAIDVIIEGDYIEFELLDERTTPQPIPGLPDRA